MSRLVFIRMKGNINIAIVVIILAIFSYGFSFVGWDATQGGRLCQLTLYLLLLYFGTNIKQAKFGDSSLKPYIMCFMLLPFLSYITAALVHGQTFGETFYSSKKHLLYILFFVLFLLKVKEEDILKVALSIGVGWCVIEIIQQICYPMVWFSTIELEEGVDVGSRNGIYRYNVYGTEFGLIMLFFCFVQYLNNRKKIFLIGILLGVTGVYFLATRQIMVTVVLCMLYGMFAMKKVKLSSVFGLSFIALLIYLNSDTLFGEYVEMTKNDLSNDEYIRLIAYEYYGITYNGSNLLQIVLGNGDPGRGTSYATEIYRLEHNLGLFRIDIGVVGLYSCYGLFYLIGIVAFFVYCFKNRRYIDIYLQMFLLYMAVTSIMLWHFGSSMIKIATMSCILYLIDRNISRKKQMHIITKS